MTATLEVNPIVELEPETLEAKVSRLEGIIKDNETRGWKAPVETVTGPRTVAEITADLRSYKDELTLQTARLKQENDDAEARNPVPYLTADRQVEWRSQNHVEPPLYATLESAQNFVGRLRWEALSSQQKAQLMTIRASDVARLGDPLDYFGNRPNAGRKSSALMKDNPAAYYALRAKAKRDGVI